MYVCIYIHTYILAYVCIYIYTCIHMLCIPQILNQRLVVSTLQAPRRCCGWHCHPGNLITVTGASHPCLLGHINAVATSPNN